MPLWLITILCFLGLLIVLVVVSSWLGSIWGYFACIIVFGLALVFILDYLGKRALEDGEPKE